ncbi:MAG: 50S ribosomal protein L13, partial [Candidatus Levyibacteriota bacterium]
GDYVVIINAKEVKVTGKKETEKFYNRHSGYPGGFKSESFADLLKRRPDEVVRHMVKGMLPQNKLGDSMMKRLFIFAGEEHTFADKFTNK